MIIKRKPLILHNVLGVKAEGKGNEWMKHAIELKKSIVKNGFYATGPVIYTVENRNDESAEFIIYIPINEPIDLEENNKYIFIKDLIFEDGFSIKYFDLEDDVEEIAENTLKLAADNYNVKLKKPFYYIYLNIYGDGIVDVYAPIESSNVEAEND